MFIADLKRCSDYPKTPTRLVIHFHPRPMLPVGSLLVAQPNVNERWHPPRKTSPQQRFIYSMSMSPQFRMVLRSIAQKYSSFSFFPTFHEFSPDSKFCGHVLQHFSSLPFFPDPLPVEFFHFSSTPSLFGYGPWWLSINSRISRPAIVIIRRPIFHGFPNKIPNRWVSFPKILFSWIKTGSIDSVLTRSHGASIGAGELFFFIFLF